MLVPVEYILKRLVPFLRLTLGHLLQCLLQSSNHPLGFSVALWIISCYAAPLDVESMGEVLHRLTIELKFDVAQYVLRWTKSHDYCFLDKLHHTKRVEQFRRYRPGDWPFRHLFNCNDQLLISGIGTR